MVYSYENYRGYSPIGFITSRLEEMKKNPLHFYYSTLDFLTWFFIKYHSNVIQDLKHLFLSPDKECNQLALQILFVEHTAAFNWLSTFFPGIFVELIDRFKN